jgi:hypothetical protein
VLDRSVHGNVGWGGLNSCDLPRQEYLLDLGIRIVLSAWLWCLVWRAGTKVVVLGVVQRGSGGGVVRNEYCAN